MPKKGWATSAHIQPPRSAICHHAPENAQSRSADSVTPRITHSLSPLRRVLPPMTTTDDSRETIPERWGERTHSRTQAQLSLNRSVLAAALLLLPTLAMELFFLSQRKRPPAGHVGAAARPGIHPYLLLLFLVQVCASVHGFRRPYTCRCVCRVSLRHLVCASTASVTSMVCI